MDRTAQLKARKWREAVVEDAKQRFSGRFGLNPEPGSDKKRVNRTSFFVILWFFEVYMYADEASIPAGMDRIEALDELAPEFIMKMEPTLGVGPTGYPIEVTTGVYRFSLMFARRTLRAAERSARQNKRKALQAA